MKHCAASYFCFRDWIVGSTVSLIQTIIHRSSYSLARTLLTRPVTIWNWLAGHLPQHLLSVASADRQHFFLISWSPTVPIVLVLFIMFSWSTNSSILLLHIFSSSYRSVSTVLLPFYSYCWVLKIWQKPLFDSLADGSTQFSCVFVRCVHLVIPFLVRKSFYYLVPLAIGYLAEWCLLAFLF